jgi:dienelactone hydrolase
MRPQNAKITRAQDAAEGREVVPANWFAPRAQLFLYPGDRHLFADRSLSSYDVDAAGMLRQRVLKFLACC